MRAASDVGGTFTDLVFYPVDPVTGAPGAIQVAKADTTSPDFERGVINSMDKAGVSAAELGFFAHGSTVVINALTERKGVKTALITTSGFRDVLEIARGNRPDLFNFNFRKPPPFVDRYLRTELPERVNFKGELVRRVELAGLPALIDFFRSEGVGAIAVAFLHAYVNPTNEQKVVEAVRVLWPEVAVLASHEISREWREYERTNTTVLSAYVYPIARTYIESLERKLADGGFNAAPYMMQSNGGIATVEAAKRNPITMIESGPASGIFAAAYLGKLIAEPNLIVLDIGGTTAKCALDRGGSHQDLDRLLRRERPARTPGYPIQTAVSEIVEIGNGGGSHRLGRCRSASCTWVRNRAGALPGPVAYGRGGTGADHDGCESAAGPHRSRHSFAGGELRACLGGRGGGVHARWARSSACSCPSPMLARGVVRIANANMTNALRLVSTNKGHTIPARLRPDGVRRWEDPCMRSRWPRELKVPRSHRTGQLGSVFSAWGMLLTDLRRDYPSHPTYLLPLERRARVPLIRETFAEITAQALSDFAGDEADKTPTFEYHADLRYEGQEHTVAIPFPLASETALETAAALFHEAHERRFTYRLDTPIQLVNFHVVATVAVDKPDLAERPVTGAAVETARIGSRRVDFDQYGAHEAAIYDGLRMEPGMQVQGPAVIQEPAVTLVAPPGKTVEVDRFGNYHVHLGARSTARTGVPS